MIDREALAVLAIGAATLVPPILDGAAGDAASACLGLLVFVAALLTDTVRDACRLRRPPRRSSRKRSA